METQKEDGTKLSSWIPLDVTIEILLRLPAKSVVRFRCVSKLWSSMISTPNFIKSFAVHSSARPSILSCSVKKEEGKRVFFSFPHQQDPKNPYTSILDKFDMIIAKTSPIHPSMKTWRCINGVLYYCGVDCSVVSFDVKSEKFLTIKKPEGCVCDMIDDLPNPKHSLISYKGRLAWIYDGFSRYSILRILEDAEKQEWSPSEFEVPFWRIPKNINYWYLLLCGDTGDDELIYAPTSTEGEFCAFFLSQEKSHTKESRIGGTNMYGFRIILRVSSLCTKIID
ncbi:hypothetical protein ARALYDRAFT_897547 [Arabidopsis lyrata subsp. lyrata]|uniref:F-box domain-containing protein n=1 Tax=Arabidopsis lyrata subsp. lyrata TaxID=81972 RepID=D7L1C1_ARALL|nr:hypothetical protein ARALYDRAFT_897547 [Arabidopsis lyrata subsp. lyrata]